MEVREEEERKVSNGKEGRGERKEKRNIPIRSSELIFSKKIAD